uniref:Uncharacterized protein n=1 Tax=Lactuca sativa TaxID=4236 RepID=A0A9R1WB53_LACSA|nr:hypothetical protein LSAT_V11C200064320 [Lactuca sativa]
MMFLRSRSLFLAFRKSRGRGENLGCGMIGMSPVLGSALGSAQAGLEPKESAESNWEPDCYGLNRFSFQNPLFSSPIKLFSSPLRHFLGHLQTHLLSQMRSSTTHTWNFISLWYC